VKKLTADRFVCLPDRHHHHRPSSHSMSGSGWGCMGFVSCWPTQMRKDQRVIRLGSNAQIAGPCLARSTLSDFLMERLAGCGLARALRLHKFPVLGFNPLDAASLVEACCGLSLGPLGTKNTLFDHFPCFRPCYPISRFRVPHSRQTAPLCRVRPPHLSSRFITANPGLLVC